jgi:hypothetical protein
MQREAVVRGERRGKAALRPVARRPRQRCRRDEHHARSLPREAGGAAPVVVVRVVVVVRTVPVRVALGGALAVVVGVAVVVAGGGAAAAGVVTVRVTCVCAAPEPPARSMSAAASTPSESATIETIATTGARHPGVAASRVRAAAPHRRHHSCSG